MLPNGRTRPGKSPPGKARLTDNTAGAFGLPFDIQQIAFADTTVPAEHK